MSTITLELPDELTEQLAQEKDRVPELLRLSLQEPVLPATVYRYILQFLVSNPTPQQIAAFQPTKAMMQRLQELVQRGKSGELTPTEQRELDEYETIEHLIVMMKAGQLSCLQSGV